MNDEVVHDPQEHLFYLQLDGQRAELHYRVREGKVLDYWHTEVPSTRRGQGWGEKLVVAALRWAQAQGYRVIPSCSYVHAIVRRRPEFAELIQGRR